MMKHLGKKRGFYVPPYEEYRKKVEAFKETSFFLFAYHNNKPVAVVWYATFQEVLVYLQTGIVQKGYDLFANYLLVWEGLKIGQKLKRKVFDFETIYDDRYPKEHVKWKGYTEFKRRFHGIEVNYPPSYIKFYNPVIKFIYLISNLITR